MPAPLASVGATVGYPIELAFPFALRTRRVIPVADVEDFVQASGIIWEVSAELADCVPWLHPLSIRMIYLLPRDNYVD